MAKLLKCHNVIPAINTIALFSDYVAWYYSGHTNLFTAGIDITVHAWTLISMLPVAIEFLLVFISSSVVFILYPPVWSGNKLTTWLFCIALATTSNTCDIDAD